MSHRRRCGSVVRLVLLAVTVALAAAACGNDDSTNAAPESTSGDAGASAVTLDIVYISHIPESESVVDEITQLFDDTADVTVSRHDVAAPDGQTFATDRGINAKFVVLVNGTSEHAIDGRTVNFEDFPDGRGTSNVPDGNWTLDELRTVVDGLIASAS